MRTLGRFAAGLALKGVLEKVTGRAEPAGTLAPARSRRRPPRRRAARAADRPGTVARPPVRRGAWFALMVASAAVSLPLMLIFESTITRVVGVVALFVFIVAGVFAIADPAFLDLDEEETA
jgi:hypothetical protein